MSSRKPYGGKVVGKAAQLDASIEGPSVHPSKALLVLVFTEVLVIVVEGEQVGSVCHCCQEVIPADPYPEKILQRTGRLSPVKRLQQQNLTPISEMPLPKVRTEVRLTVDKKGRARTETVLIREEVPTATRRNEAYDSSHYDSSTDEEEIIIPSRSTSFAVPPPKGPKLARFEASARDVRRYSTSASNSYSESSSQHSLMDGVESEAETVVEEEDSSGDATRALRKVMEKRKEQMKQRNPQHHRYSSDIRHGSHYMGYASSSNLSPTTVYNPEGATPSSTRSGTTRCVCGKPESEGFMIQW
jgi:hypothetical protein